MKKLSRMAVMLLAAGTMAMVACKPEKIAPEGPVAMVSEVNGVTWVKEERFTSDDGMGHLREVVESRTLMFDSVATGQFVYVLMVNSVIEKKEIFPFTYTYASPSGRLTMTEEGSTFSVDFAYDASRDKLVLYFGTFSEDYSRQPE